MEPTPNCAAWHVDRVKQRIIRDQVKFEIDLHGPLASFLGIVDRSPITRAKG